MNRCMVSPKNVVLLGLSLLVAGRAAAYERQVQDLADELAARLAAERAPTVAVVDFTDLRGDVNELGRFLAEELSISLTEAAAGRFRVIDRTRLAVVFAEHELGASGLIAPEEAKRLGQLVGADLLVSATITPFGETVRLSIKALDTETATLRASARGDVPRTGAIDELLRRGMGERRSSAGGVGAAGSPKAESLKAKSFAFEIEGCTLSGSTADCLLLVENQVADRSLLLVDSSRLYDELGNEYAPQRLRIANSVKNVTSGGLPAISVGGRLQWRSGVGKVILKGVPTAVELTFEGVDPQASRVSLLQIVFVADDTPFEVGFRDLSFRSDGP